MKSCCICLFINLLLSYCVTGQSITPSATFSKTTAENITSPRFTLNNAIHADTLKNNIRYTTPFTFMASNYYTSTLGFFCKKEVEIEKVLKFPVKFRLGSVAYTDKMEGKGSGVFLPTGKR